MVIPPRPPEPTATTATEVTPVGATHEYEPEVIYAFYPGVTPVVTELLAELSTLLPTEFVARTVNV